MKKIMAFIFATILILNLLPQPSDAFRLSQDNNSVIYGDWEGEKEAWETFYLPCAKYFKLASKNATVLDIAKIAQDEQEKNVSAYTIIHKIMDTTDHARRKMLVKWEKENGYIDTTGEEHLEITPTIRRELLKEIEEEEEKGKEKANQFWWKTAKAGAKFATTITAFVVSIFLKQDISTSAAKATLVFTATSTVIDGAEVMKEFNFFNRFKSKPDVDEEIKLPPPLRNMPKIPANHTRVDLYSL
jgi:hypothetical protein